MTDHATSLCSTCDRSHESVYATVSATTTHIGRHYRTDVRVKR
jgi:hypothetical protein